MQEPAYSGNAAAILTCIPTAPTLVQRQWGLAELVEPNGPIWLLFGGAREKRKAVMSSRRPGL